MTVRATVVIPTHDHGPTLRHTIPTALDQTVPDLEVFVIGDGVPEITRSIVDDFVRGDERVRFFDHPKGPRHGEIYRHRALQEARGEIVCYLSDDDLWLPDHVEYMLELLGDSDFAHSSPVRLDGDGIPWVYPGDLATPPWRAELLAGRNFIPLSMGAHTLRRYRELEHGWRTTPRGTPTDLYMWQQILSDPSCRAISGSRTTVLNFPGSIRPGESAEDRARELEAWTGRRNDPRWREDFRAQVGDFLFRERARLEGLLVTAERPSQDLAAENLLLREDVRDRDRELATAYATRTWRMRGRMLKVPGVGALLRRRTGLR